MEADNNGIKCYEPVDGVIIRPPRFERGRADEIPLDISYLNNSIKNNIWKKIAKGKKSEDMSMEEIKEVDKTSSA